MTSSNSETFAESSGFSNLQTILSEVPTSEKTKGIMIYLQPSLIARLETLHPKLGKTKLYRAILNAYATAKEAEASTKGTKA